MNFVPEYPPYEVVKKVCGIYFPRCCQPVCSGTKCWCKCDDCCILYEYIDSAIFWHRINPEYSKQLIRIVLHDLYSREHLIDECLGLISRPLVDAIMTIYTDLID